MREDQLFEGSVSTYILKGRLFTLIASWFLDLIISLLTADMNLGYASLCTSSAVDNPQGLSPMAAPN